MKEYKYICKLCKKHPTSEENQLCSELELSIFVQCLNPQNYAASANGCSRCLL